MNRDNTLTVIETTHNVKTIPSELCRNLYYVFDDDRQGIGILTFLGDDEYQFIGLSREQTRALKNELGDIYNVILN